MDARTPLDEAALRADVLTGVWTGLRVLARTGSTNADAAEAARDGAPEGLIILAEDQTAGRGRLDRVWQTPPHAAITMRAPIQSELNTNQMKLPSAGEWNLRG